jgi:disulfide bond formation protein DsbB
MNKRSQHITLLIIIAVVWLGTAAGSNTGVAQSGDPPVRPASANGNAFADLVVGVSEDNWPPGEWSGAVSVLHGSLTGLSDRDNQFWNQDSPGILDSAEHADRFGYSLATGDFDGDGYVDLAVGVEEEEVGGVLYAGAVNIIYGSAEGLSEAGNQFWHQDSPGIAGGAEEVDLFGWSLAAGDFDGDGYTDLAVGVWGEEVGGVLYAGAVNVIYGSADGLSEAGNQMWHQDSPDIEGGAELGDRFGSSLAAADFDGDGYADLAVGVIGEDIGDVAGAGAVNIIYGSADGLSEVGDQMWHEDSPGILGVAENEDFFGRTLATGDFDGDGYADLAVGVPEEDVGTTPNAGGLNILYGSADGLSEVGNQAWHQDSTLIPDGAEEGDRFASSLATADINGDGYTDLAVGVSGEEVGGVLNAGALHVLFGSADGLSAADNQFWHQDSPGVADAAEERDNFSAALAACDLDGDGYADLAVGVPDEAIGGIAQAGAVNVLYGSAGGLSEAGNQFWHQDSPGILDDAEEFDWFGYTLACMPGTGTVYRVHLPAVIQ